MKKLFSLFLVVTMLATMMAAFAINTSAADALSVNVYFAQDGTNLYLVFNKPVAIPAEARLSLVGHGWPVEVDGQQVFRYLRRMNDEGTPNSLLTNVEYFGDTKQVLKVTVADPTPGNYDWYYNPTGPCASSEAPVAGATGTVADFCLMVFGEIKTVDGKETLAVEDFDTVSPVGAEPVWKGTKTTWNVVATTNDIVVPEYTAPVEPTPDTFDALTIVALVGLAASGTIVATKKRH